jgi:flagellar protein FlbD
MFSDLLWGYDSQERGRCIWPFLRRQRRGLYGSGFLSHRGQFIGPGASAEPLPRRADNNGRGATPMIHLSKLNGNPMVLNSDLIKTAEASPDTMLTLITGEKLIVRESLEEVTEQVLAYRARLLANVARHLPDSGALARAVSITSLDVANRPNEPEKLLPRSSNH